MARKPNSAASAKAAKQKKTLIALAVVLVLALGYAYHTMSGMNKSGGSTPVAATISTPATTPAATTSAATTTPAAPTTTPAAPAATTPAVLVAAVQPAVGSGQLQSFSRFDSKDPFATGGPKTAAPAASSPSAPARAPAKPAAPQAQKPVAITTPPPTTAVLAVNGEAETVTLDADFPVSTDPTQNGLFHLVALTARTATVSVVGGSYASGSPTLTLKVNKPVTLVNTADGKRYTLQLFPQGTPPPAAPSTGAAPPAPTTTAQAAP